MEAVKRTVIRVMQPTAALWSLTRSSKSGGRVYVEATAELNDGEKVVGMCLLTFWLGDRSETKKGQSDEAPNSRMDG